MNYPILEHDPSREAFIEPSDVVEPMDVPKHCVISFFRETIEKIADEYHAKVLVDNCWEDGSHKLYEIEYKGRRLAFFHPGVGAPISAGLLEEMIAYGCRKFIACGGCGVLEKDIAVGHLFIVSAAVRDEGVSYHYLPPSREVEANRIALETLIEEVESRNLPYHVGKTWTTDAPYRETPDKIAKRKAEGCLTVEMEAAGMMAVAAFRNVIFGQVLYGGDDLSGDEWDNRKWQSRTDVREQLFWMSADACLCL